MLASAQRETLKSNFSRASDIVELVVLTNDDAFLRTLRDVVGDARRLWHVAAPEKVSDLLMAGQVGIVVLDTQPFQATANVFVSQIKRQFPDLVILVAGTRGAELSLASLISGGTVYRFIHKPMSPGRAKLFAEAAVKKYQEQRKRAPALRAATRPPEGQRKLLLGGAIFVGVLAAAIAVSWALRHHTAEPRAPQDAVAGGPEAPLAADGTVIAPNGSGVPNGSDAPSGEDALDKPADAAARGIAEMHERLLARAENALLEEHLDEAATAIEAARKAGVESGRIAFLSAALAKSQKAAHRKNDLTAVRASADLGHPQPAGLPIGPSQDSAGKQADVNAWDHQLRTAWERIQQDRLIEPANDNAKYYLLNLRNANPTYAGLAPALQDLGARMIAKARRAIDQRQYDAAGSWLDEATAVGSSSEADAARRDLEAARGDLETAQRNSQALRKDGTTVPTESEAAASEAPSHILSANELNLVKSVRPVYPQQAEKDGLEGWVELDFTVAESGQVKDVAVHAANPRGVFNSAAVGAVSQWRYEPVLRGATPTAQRARIRIRFALVR